jgi:hypothetical protein
MPNAFASAAELDRETTAYWIEVADSLGAKTGGARKRVKLCTLHKPATTARNS